MLVGLELTIKFLIDIYKLFNLKCWYKMYILFSNGKNIPLDSIGGIFMKKRNGILIFLFCITLFLASFIYGYKIMGHRINKKPLITDKNQEEDIVENLDLEILREDERISPNTFIEKTIHYNTCNHNITKLNNADNEIINMTEKQYREYIKENYPNIKIISFSISEIVLREERDHLCENHYIIGQSDGKIAIYGIDENGERFLNKIFNDYSISLLKKIDQEKLTKGIVVDSEEDLSDVLENFIS